MAGSKAGDNGLHFRTRNYKHEIRLTADGARSVLNYSDELWETLCGQIAAHDFTGLVLYSGYHPFENILDYQGFEDVASQPAEHRAAVRQRLQSGLAIAHKHGLKTFIQHYLSHFTPQLAAKYGIHVQGRLANVDHPEVDRYARYCYRAIFQALPDLDGLYFNYESAASNWPHVLRTAIPEFNAMDRKPIMVYRLWDFKDIEGMRKLMEAYQGRVILGHKVDDTNDTYYLPVADSRVMEWKKRLSKDIEWMFLIGPCHNCGTNLCNQLWGDYAYMQTLLADMEKKGADSFSFHTINEFFAPDMPASVTVFGDHEKAMARFNTMHLQAVVDSVRGQSKTSDERAIALAQRVGVSEKAGASLLDAVESSSQLVLLAYQQFCFTSAAEGYRHRGFISHIQDPFMYTPATEFNHQSKRPEWSTWRPEMAWVQKTIDTVVAPDNFLQYVIDYADPSKPKAKRNPKQLAALLEQNIKRADAALKQYRKLAGPQPAEELEKYLRENAVHGDIVRRELLAAIQFYGIYFAKTKPAAEAAMKKGLQELKGLQARIDKLDKPTFKTVQRVMLFNRGPNVKPEIDLVTKALAGVRKGNLPWPAYRAYLQSRQLYNEIRRRIRPGRQYPQKAIAEIAAPLLEQAMAKALESVAALREPKQAGLARNVRAWLEYLGSELARIVPPTATCAAAPSGQWKPLQRNHDFRYGESFAEDFVGFFESSDYIRPGGLRFDAWHTDNELVVCLREEGVSTQERFAWWEKCKDDTSSCSFITRVHLDPHNTGRHAEMVVVWPEGTAVSFNKVPEVRAKVEFSHDATWWQTTVYIPFDLIGKRPSAGQSGLNVTANPAIVSTSDYTWAPQYDAQNPQLFGRLTFA